MSTHAFAPGHRVSDKPDGIHFPRNGTAGHVTCGPCDVTVTALPDEHYPDKWQPLVDQWFEHRAQRPALSGRKGHPSRTPVKNPHLFRGGA